MTANTESEHDFFAAVKGGKLAEVCAAVASDPALLQARDGNSFGGPALNLAIFRNDRAMVDALLDLDADPNLESDWWAGPWVPVQCALTIGQLGLAQHLVDRGAQVGVHEAAGLSRCDDLKRLLSESPQRVHQRGGDGCTPLHFAGSTEVVDLLLDHGADIDARDVDHYSTPAQYLGKFNPPVARYLFEHGAAVDIFSLIMAGSLTRMKRLIRSDPTVLEQRINRDTFPPGPEHEVDNIMTFTVGHNATPVHAAATAERLEVIDALIEAGCDVDAIGGYDESTALHLAAWNDSLEVAKKLVEAGADINKRSGEIHNNSPAGWAIVAGSADVFNYLMDQGAGKLDHFIADAKASLRGEHLQYKCVPMANYQQTMNRLTQDA